MSEAPHRILVTSCSSGIGQEIYHSLVNRRDVELYGIDTRDNTPGKCLFGPRFYPGAPPLSEERRFVEYVKYFCESRQISYLFAGRDSDINVLKQEESFIGVSVITSPLETCVVARSKKQTYEKLRDVVRVPEMFEVEKVKELPVFVKPDFGAGSVGCRRIDTMEELVSGYDKERDLITEVLTGAEYTVDSFTDLNGELLYHCPRERTITRAGISVVTSAVTDGRVLGQVQDMADKINNTIHFIGAWFFQVKESSDGSLCLLEIAPRVGGSSSFSRASGVNLPLLSLNLAMGLPVKVPSRDHPQRTMKLYKTFIDPPLTFHDLYLDLDDTIILRNVVNPSAMSCIYKYHGKGVRIHLITRNPGDLSKILSSFHIPCDIFASIHQISDLSVKSRYMIPNSVFVDDSFSERDEVSSSGMGIRCFDVDFLNFL